MILVNDSLETRTLDWIAKQLTDEERKAVQIRNMTDDIGILQLHGPKVKDTLGKLGNLQADLKTGDVKVRFAN